MSQYQLTKIRLSGGVWDGVLIQTNGTDGEPMLSVRHLDQPVTGIEVERADTPGHWHVRVPVPVHAIADGVQTFTIFDQADDSKLGHFTFLAGEAMADDIRVELDLLRAELDMLKRAFRRHCLETS